MQNKGNYGCPGSFVPVSGNWDFTRAEDCGCQNPRPACNNRRNRQQSACQCKEKAQTAAPACTEARAQPTCAPEKTCPAPAAAQETTCRCVTARTCETTTAPADPVGCSRNQPCERNQSCERTPPCGQARDAFGHRNRGVGMIHAMPQQLAEIYQPAAALTAGTLYPELHKPMNGYCPANNACGDCEQQVAFALWELRLYLDTHPGDGQALALFERLKAEAADVNYATTFLPDTGCVSAFGWVSDPWPWQNDFCCE